LFVRGFLVRGVVRGVDYRLHDGGRRRVECTKPHPSAPVSAAEGDELHVSLGDGLGFRHWFGGTSRGDVLDGVLLVAVGGWLGGECACLLLCFDHRLCPRFRRLLRRSFNTRSQTSGPALSYDLDGWFDGQGS